jgi:hypothetical protein
MAEIKNLFEGRMVEFVTEGDYGQRINRAKIVSATYHEGLQKTVFEVVTHFGNTARLTRSEISKIY